MVRLPAWPTLGGPQAPHVTISIAPWASAKLAGGPNRKPVKLGHYAVDEIVLAVVHPQFQLLYSPHTAAFLPAAQMLLSALGQHCRIVPELALYDVPTCGKALRHLGRVQERCA